MAGWAPVGQRGVRERTRLRRERRGRRAGLCPARRGLRSYLTALVDPGAGGGVGGAAAEARPHMADAAAGDGRPGDPVDDRPGAGGHPVTAHLALEEDLAVGVTRQDVRDEHEPAAAVHDRQPGRAADLYGDLVGPGRVSADSAPTSAVTRTLCLKPGSMAANIASPPESSAFTTIAGSVGSGAPASWP